MNKKIVFIVGIVLAIAGAIIGCFSFPGADVVGLAMALFGAGTMCANMWKNRKKETPTWLTILSMCLVGVGAFLCGFVGILGFDNFKAIIDGIIAIVLIIIGAIIPTVANKKLDKKDVKI